MPSVPPRIKVAFAFAGYVFTVKEVAALMVALVVFLGSLFGRAWTESAIYAGLLAVTMAIGAGVAIFVVLMVIAEKWMASSPANVTGRGDVTSPINGVEARGEVGSVSPTITRPSRLRKIAANLVKRLGRFLDADPAQIAEYRRVYMKKLSDSVSSTATLDMKVIRATPAPPTEKDEGEG
jgi:hypothetical protein